jgi:FlaG/FlaF family flagellin (archaellin)
MMKIFRDKRGVSPVVSAMIMIVVVMVGMSAIFGFVINYNRDFQSGSGSAVFESMTVEDVWFRSDRFADMWIFNLGKVSMDISYVYVNGDAVSFYNLTSKGLTVDVGEHLKIRVFPDFVDFVEGDSYVFKVATSRGTTFEGIWTR